MGQIPLNRTSSNRSFTQQISFLRPNQSQLRFNSHFPGVPGSLLVLFVHRLQNRSSGDECRKFIMGLMPFPTSVFVGSNGIESTKMVTWLTVLKN